MATTVRVRAGETLSTDGPYAETKEQLGGFYIFECEDLDEAIEIAARIPSAESGYIEIRPVFEAPELSIQRPPSFQGSDHQRGWAIPGQRLVQFPR